MVDHTRSTDATHKLDARLRADADLWRRAPTTSLRARVVAAASRQLPEFETSARLRFPRAAGALLAACIALTVLVPPVANRNGDNSGVRPAPERLAGLLRGIDEQFTAERERVEALLASSSLTEEAQALAMDLEAVAQVLAQNLPSVGAWVGGDGDRRDLAEPGAESEAPGQP